MKKNARRGVTMAELCIAIAVISVVSTMVVSFSVLVAERNNSAHAKLETITDINFIETMVEEWFEKAVVDGSITVNRGGWQTFGSGTGIRSSNGSEIKVNKENDIVKSIEIKKPNEINGTIIEISNNITEITFTISSETLYYCTIEYETRGYDNGTEYYTFCVNTKMGY